jgi:pimeloyl-ACP methyl ester carboxylesterase
MPHALIRGIDVHYMTDGRGPDVIMIHGFLENLSVWHVGLAPLLRDRFRVTTYDLRGHGYSGITPRGYQPAELAADLAALMDARGIARAAIVGRSFGADVALAFCADHPDRVERLVAIEPALVGGLAHPGDEAWGGWRYWTAQLEESGVSVPPDSRYDLRYLLERTVQTLGFDGLFGQTVRRRDRLLRLIRDTTLVDECGEVFGLTADAVRRIDVPALLIYGDRSPFLASFEFLRAALPRCAFQVVSDAGHLTPRECAADVGEEIRRFLADGSPDASRTVVLRACPAVEPRGTRHAGQSTGN